MSYDILTILQEKDPTFSKGQRRIARYITEAYDKAAFMTANRLGKTVGVSESTVVRFAVDLGFDGYPSMQKAMQEMVLNRLTSVKIDPELNAQRGKEMKISTPDSKVQVWVIPTNEELMIAQDTAELVNAEK